MSSRQREGRSDADLVIVGGGFTGTVLAMNVARLSPGPLDIVMVEPGAELGRGIAYGSRDGAHRINVPSDRMDLFKESPGQATRWLSDQGILPDPASDDGSGQFYPARQHYGDFVTTALAETLGSAGPRIHFAHRRTSVCALDRADGWTVTLQSGERLAAKSVALCFGHATPTLPCPMAESVARAAKFVPDPWADDALKAIEAGDRVLIVGTGLTMADVVMSLRERRHTGPITAVSRRGLLPREHGVFRGDIDLFEKDSVPTTALGLLRLLRRRIREDGAALGGWHGLVDALRFKLPEAWGALPRTEKAKVLRRLLAFWDVHRFRIAPQVAAGLEDSRVKGQLLIKKAVLAGLAREGDAFKARLKRPGTAADERLFDSVVLCSGPEKDLRRNPLIADLLAKDFAQLDDTGFGLAVDAHSRLIVAEGRIWPSLLAFGPMTRGTFGEMTGAPDIAKFIERQTARMVEGTPWWA